MSIQKKLGGAALVVFVAGLIVLLWPTSREENFATYASEGLVGGGLLGISLLLLVAFGISLLFRKAKKPTNTHI